MNYCEIAEHLNGRFAGPDKLIRNPVFGFGVMDFDLTRADPELRFNIVPAASELRNGVNSWRTKTKPAR